MTGAREAFDSLYRDGHPEWSSFELGWRARGSADLGALPTNLANIDQWNDGRSKGVAECRRAIASLDEHPPERHAPALDGTDNPGATE